jgi:hypothetical protein
MDIFYNLLEDELHIYNLNEELLENMDYIDAKTNKKIFSPYILDHYFKYRNVMFELEYFNISEFSDHKNKILKILNWNDISKLCNKYLQPEHVNNIRNYIISDKKCFQNYIINKSIIFLFNYDIYTNPFSKPQNTVRYINRFAVCGKLPSKKELSNGKYPFMRNSRYFPRLISFISKYIHIDDKIAIASSFNYQRPNGYYYIPYIYYIICDVKILNNFH